MDFLPYRCFWDVVKMGLYEDGDLFTHTTALIRCWKFDESIRTLTAVDGRECLVSLGDMLDGGEELSLEMKTHLTELGIQDRYHGWMIVWLIKHIVEQIIPHMSPQFYSVTLNIVEVTSEVSRHNIKEALDLQLMMEKLQLVGRAEECEDLSCVICMEEGKAAFALMSCKHVFHVRCVARWFKINPLCPICRRYSKPK